jgi:flagellar biosynthesis protein FlhG
MSWLSKFGHNKGHAGALNRGTAADLKLVPAPKKKIWTVGGGKGGVGKSFMASNLGIFLARSGKKVLLIDADLGAANLHTLVRAEKSRMSLSNFLITGNLDDLRHLIAGTSVQNVDLISGARDSLDVADFNGDKLRMLREAIEIVEYDHVVLDIGPGTSKSNLELFNMADEGVIVNTPDPTSIENSYRFLKCLYRHRLRNIINSQEDGKLKELLQKALCTNGQAPPMTIADIFRKIEQLDGDQGRFLKRLMAGKRISIVINQAKNPADMDIGPAMKRACHDYFGLEVGYLGCINYDDCVVDSIRQRKPLIIHFNQSEAAKAVVASLYRLQDAKTG